MELNKTKKCIILEIKDIKNDKAIFKSRKLAAYTDFEVFYDEVESNMKSFKVVGLMDKKQDSVVGNQIELDEFYDLNEE